MSNDTKKSLQCGDIIFYATPDGVARVDVFFEDETFWLTQRRMAELFGVDVRTINEHIGNVYESRELDRLATIRKFRIVQREGQRSVERAVEHYSLDAIISVGYRVKLPARFRCEWQIGYLGSTHSSRSMSTTC